MLCDARPAILVVDDESMIRMILERALGRKYDVTAVGGPQEALAAVQNRQFELVMTDINMPGGSGLMLAASLRKQIPQVKIAVLAAVIDEEVQGRIEALGATLFVKPFDLPELVAMVERLIKCDPQALTGKG